MRNESTAPDLVSPSFNSLVRQRTGDPSGRNCSRSMRLEKSSAGLVRGAKSGANAASMSREEPAIIGTLCAATSVAAPNPKAMATQANSLMANLPNRIVERAAQQPSHDDGMAQSENPFPS